MTDFEKLNGEEVSVPTLNNAAPRWKRFVAIFIDLFISSTCAEFFIDQEKSESFKNELLKYNFALPPEVFQQFISYQINCLLILILTFFALNSYLLYKRGQTVGKVIMKIAIRDLKNNQLAFAHLVVARYLVQVPMMFIPLLTFVDYIFIVIRKDRRSIHDLIAKTKVVDLTVQVASSTPTFVA